MTEAELKAALIKAGVPEQYAEARANSYSGVAMAACSMTTIG